MNDLYGKSVLKLALIYASIIGVISIFFSFNLFLATTNEINRALDRQERQLQQRGFRQPAIDSLRTEQYKDAKEAIVGKLIFANFIIISAGGLASYVLARKTLQPIKDAHDAQERFTSDASHELRTPLTAIISETEVALRDKNLTKTEAKEILVSNLAEIKAMSTLTDNLLTLTKHEKIAKENFTTFDIAKNINSTVKKFKSEASAKNVKIKTNTKKVTVNAHEPSLTQIIGILIENAIKYSKPKGVVEVLVGTNRRTAEVSVKDQGQGIKKQNLPYVFDRFYRADTSRSKDDGYGLGLSIAKRLANAQGLTIKAQSKPKSGSTFSIEVPLAQGRNNNGKT